MKINDFEKAIEALCVDGLVIDEMKMKANGGGHVNQANGHTDALTIVWDESGRAFTTSNQEEKEEFIGFNSGKTVIGRRLKRDTVYDLKFE